ncbi:MAG: calcium-binding protein, partial [Sulfurimonadaceae bacterium]|nr:calcium-binding protein [Sulfurimonadaceae bacterium]
GNSYLKEDETTVVVNNGSANDRDKVSYDQVESFSLAELKYLKDNSFITSQDYEKLIGEFQLFDDNGFEIPNTLINVEMEKYYNGVYIDLDGFSIDLHEDIDGNIIEGEKINALSKFAKVSDFGFITNDEGTVTGHNADMNIFKNKSLDNILFGGEDNYKDINDIDGSAYNDTIYGNSDKNIIHGLAGNDYIDGRNGGNELYGGAGNDTLVSGSGDDYIDGGEDSDTVSYQNSAGGVTVRLDRPNGEQYDFATGHGNDTLISIENVIGSNHNDMIYGSSSTNYIEGMGGNDYIFSGQGINFIDGGDGVDKISYNAQDYRDASSGNTNANYIKYLDNLGGINVTLGADFAMVRERSGANKDALIDLVKNIEQVSGSRGNDYIRGTNKDETFWGNDGNDELRGEGGNDLLYGGAGDDIIRPGSGLDKSWGGTGVDYLELYDDGINTQAVTNAIQRLRLSDSGTIEYSYDATTRTDGTWTNGYDAHGGINEAYEFEGFGGSNGANIMYGNSQANVLNGHNGNDIIYGMGGDDIFYGSIYYGSGTDKDQYHGGEGNDTLDYSKTNHNYAMTVIVTGAGDGKASFTGLADADYQDTFTSIERFIASRGNDTIDTSASTIGMYLDGGAGKDFIYGGTGNDTIIARNQAGEILDGGGGIDTLKLAQSINFRNLHTVSNFEILDFGTNNNYYAQFSVTQWNLNDFSKIIGGANNRLYIYGTGGDDSFNLQNIDFSGFSGALYTPANSGNDTIDLTHATSIEQVKLYLDGGANTDTLKIGTDDFTTIKLTENYFNTFEKFEIADGSTLNVNAQNNNNLNFGSNSVGGKDFTAVSGEINMTGGAGNNIFYAYQDNFTGMSGKINMDGGAGNDIFYANYEALLDGKLKIDGGSGDGDLIDVRTAQTNSNLIFDNANMFKNIEKLDLHNISNTNNISMDARAMDKWLGGDSLTLDLSNATQANKVSITNATSIKDMVSGVDVTSFAIGGNYHIIAQDNTSFDLHVV